MYNVTSNFLNAIKQNGRTFKAYVTVRDTIFDDNNIVEIDLDENVNPTESFMIGGVGSPKLEVTLMNVPSSLILENAPVTATISLLVNGTYEDVPLGVFTVDEVDINKNSITLICYDNMIKLEQAYFSDLSYPVSINAVAQEICTKAGIQLAVTLPSTQINKITGYTYREAISFIASFLGGFARFNRDGKLAITTYTDSGVSLDKNNYFPNFTTSQSLFTIGKLTCKAGSTTDSNGNSVDNILTAGTNGNEVQFENPIMTQDQLNSIYNTLKNLSYMPYSMDWQGNQALQAGDKITITDLQGNVYNTLLMDNKITYKGAITASASAVGKTQTGQNFSSSGNLSNSVDRLVTEQANIKVLLANTATIENLTATNARIDNLYATSATITALTATNARIDNLNSVYATIDNLNATNAKIDNLVVGTAQIEDASITSAKIIDASIVTAKIADGTITTAKILDGNITSAKIALAAIDTAWIKDGAITNAKIGTAVIGTANIQNAAITSALIGNGQILTANIGDAQITGAKIASATIEGANIDSATITAANIKNATITSAQIASATITSANIALATITDANIASLSATKITSGTLDASKATITNINASNINAGTLSASVIGAGSITAAKMATGTITAASGVIANATITGALIASATITGTNIASATITSANIANAAIGNAQIGSAAIGTAQIQTGAITTALIGTSAVGTSQIADGSITDAKIVSLTANKITAGTIDAGVINVTNLNAANITVGTINGQQIANGTITASNILDGTITTTELTSSLNTTINTAYSNVSIALANASTAQATADGKNTVFYGSSTPTPTKAGDLWMKTVTGGIAPMQWNGSAWVSTTDIATINAQSSVDNLQIGGANLLNYSDFTDTSQWWGYTAINMSDYLGKNSLTLKRTNWTTGQGRVAIGQSLSAQQFPLQKAGAIYTMSAWLYVDTSVPNNGSTGNNFFLRTFKASDGTIFDYVVVSNLSTLTPNTWVYVSGTITLSYDVGMSTLPNLSLDLQQNGCVKICMPKLELGNKATTWTPAVTDVQSQIDSTVSNITTINTVTIPNTLSSANSTAQGYANTAQSNAISTASSDATTKANNAQSTAISTAASDATTKSNNAQSNAISSANGYTDGKVTTLNGTISTAQATADGKNTVYRQTTTPTGGTYKVNDTWFDTANGNRISIWTGSAWTLTQLGNAAVANLDAGNITSGYISASRINAGTITSSMIASRTIQADRIASGVITANEIASRTITANNLVAGTITSNEIAANTITASDIAANTITSSQIAGNTITGVKIAAGTITASNIAAGTITSASGVIGALDAGAITTGTLDANRIGANTITTDKLLIGDFTNLLNNPNYNGDANGWTNTGYVATDGYLVNGCQTFTNSGSTFNLNIVDCKPGDQFYVSVWYKTGTPYSGVGGIRVCTDTTGATDIVATNFGQNISWAQSSVTFTIPSGKTQFAVGLKFAMTGTCWVDNWECRRISEAVLIQDGAITASKITASTITGDKIASNTITSANIQANTITASQIASNTITSTQIASRTITADRIVAGAITANEIASSTITTNQIAANTITGGDIAASTITAGNIAAGTITTSQLASSVGQSLDISSNSSITIKADKSYVDAIQVGGRNLIKNSAFSIDRTGWTNGTVDTSVTYLGHNTLRLVPNNVANQNVVSMLKPNTTYTLSCYAKWSGVAGTGEFGLYNEGNAPGYSYYAIADTDWTKYTRTFTTTASLTACTVGWYFKYTYTSGTAWVTMFKLEEGNKATDWSPAPEDSPNNANIISTINISPESIGISASKIQISGTVYLSSWSHASDTTKIDGGDIYTGSITANKIAANTITASSGVIATGAITDAMIANATITNASIKTGTITNALIASGTITNASIASATITGANIANATITSTQIASATIQDANIANLNASKINAGTLDANRIGASSITADKLLIGDMVNYAAWPNKGTASSCPFSGVTIDTSTFYSSTASYKFVVGQINGMKNNIPVMSGDIFLVDFWAKKDATWNGTAGNSKIRFADQDGNFIGAISFDTAGTSWTHITGTITIGSGDKYVSVSLNNADATTGTVWLDEIVIAKQNDATMIADGAITTNKMIANSINGDRIAANTITAAKLQANTITAASGVIASIDAGKITTGTLDASKITVTNLSASSITTGTLSGRTITGGTISGTTISGSTITSTNSNSNLTISGASLIGTINGKQGLVIGDHSVGFQDWANAGAVAAGMFLSYGSDLTNGNTTGLCIGTAKGYLGFGKEAADGSSISSDFLINYGYNPSGILEKFIYYGDFNMKGYNIYNAGWITCNDYDLGIGSGYSGAGTLRNILRIQKGTGKFTLAGDQSSDQWSDFYGNINFHGWTQAHMQLDHKTIVVGSDGWLIRGGGISDLTFVNGTSPYIQVTREIVGGQEAWGVATWLSDISLKNNIADSSINALELVKSIRHRQFIWNDSGRIQKLGYVAQELQQLEDSLVLKITQPDGRVFMQPNETVIIPYLSKAIQELSSKIDNLQQQITELQVKQAS